MFNTIRYLISSAATNASMLQLAFVVLIGSVGVATAQEKTHHQTPQFYLAEKITLSGTENIHIVDAEVEKPTNFLVLTNLSSVTNANQVYVIEGTYTAFTSFDSATEKVLNITSGKNSKAIKKVIAKNTPKNEPTVQSSTQYQSSPIFPFFPIKFFSIEQSLGASSTSTYPIPTKKALVSSTFSIYNNNEKLLKATIAYNNRETTGTINKQFRTHTFSLPPPR